MTLRPPRLRCVLRRLATPLLLVLSLGSASLPAKPIQPPLEQLYDGDNRLLAGTLLDVDPKGRLVFERKDVLDGKPRPPEKIDVRAPLTVLNEVKVGQRYVFGYATGQKDPRDPLRRIAREDGAELIVSVGLEPALFRDTPDTRALLSAGRSERGRESRRTFDLLLKALAGDDPALQNLAAGQIALDAELGEHLREHGRDTVERAARDAKMPPSARTWLLRAAEQRPRDFGDWWQSLSLDVVTNTPVGGYARSPSDPFDLVLTALELLDQHAAQVPPDALKRWVWSTNPALAERASVMLRRQSAALERSTIQQALADPALPPATRTFLEGHLRRLDRLDARTKTRKEGAR